MKKLVVSCWLLVVGCGKFVKCYSFVVDRFVKLVSCGIANTCSNIFVTYFKIKSGNLYLGLKFSHYSLLTTYYLLLTFSFSLLTSCSLIQPPEDIPSYVRVQSYSFTDSAKQGTASNNITDIEVTSGPDYRGFYQLPVSVPILQKGNQTITIQAAVYEDGIVANILPYPFYTPYVTTANLVPGKLDTIKPKFTYSSNTKYLWTEGNFEGPALVLKPLGDNSALISHTHDKNLVFEGTSCFEADFIPRHDTMDVRSDISFVVANEPPDPVVWLEINYKTDVPMDIGIIPSSLSITTTDLEFISGVNPTSTWKKVYVNIGPTLQYWYSQDQPNQTNYEIYFFATDNSGANAHIYIDNLKLLSF